MLLIVSISGFASTYRRCDMAEEMKAACHDPDDPLDGAVVPVVKKPKKPKKATPKKKE